MKYATPEAFRAALDQRIRSLPDELDHHEHEPRHTPAHNPQDAAAASNGHGSNKDQIVGAAGFEPAIPRPQSECDTRLRYAP